MAIAETMYGSDKAGLVCAYLFRPGEPGRPIESEAAADLLAAQFNGALEFLWLHFSLTNAASEQWLRRHTTLPAAFYDAFQEGSSTRVEVVDGTLLAVINDVQFFASEASAAATVTLCVTDRLIVRRLAAQSKPSRAANRSFSNARHQAKTAGAKAPREMAAPSSARMARHSVPSRARQ